MAGATIRYTVDGSTPTESSTEVPLTGEVLVNQSLTVRARVFAPGFQDVVCDLREGAEIEPGNVRAIDGT